MKIETNNNLWFQPIAYDSERFNNHDIQVVKRKEQDALNAIRWRHMKDDNMLPLINQQGHLKTQTNARIIKWQDNTQSLIVGNRYYNLKSIRAKQSQLFESKKNVKTGNQVQDQVGNTNQKLTARPTRDFTTEQMLVEKDDTDKDFKRIKSTTNYEQMKKNLELEEVHKGNEEYKKLKSQLKNEKFRDREFYTEDYLEEGAERRGPARRRKYSSEEEAEAVDEPSENDSFINDEEEEIEASAEEDEGDQDKMDSDEEEEYQYKRRSEHNEEKDGGDKRKRAKIDDKVTRGSEKKLDRRGLKLSKDEGVTEEFKSKRNDRKTSQQENVNDSKDFAPKKIKKLKDDSDSDD